MPHLSIQSEGIKAQSVSFFFEIGDCHRMGITVSDPVCGRVNLPATNDVINDKELVNP